MEIKNKAKPEAVKTVINHGKKENAITLVALIITIIALVIISAVTIRGITGKEGILASTSKIADTYVVTQYKEQIEQLMHSIILKDSLLRENNNNPKYGRGHATGRLDSKSHSTRRQSYNSNDNRRVHI